MISIVHGVDSLCVCLLVDIFAGFAGVEVPVTIKITRPIECFAVENNTLLGKAFRILFLHPFYDILFPRPLGIVKVTVKAFSNL